MATEKRSPRQLDAAVHRRLLELLIEHGYAALPEELGDALHTTPAEIRDSLARLESEHSVVLHPGTSEPWLVHPFSTTPTLFYVTGKRRGWWAPCIWCALGIAVLVPDQVRITTRLGGETQDCEISYDAGTIRPSGLLAHFPVPVARAWDNVHRHCALTLVFADEAAIAGWCREHGVARGEIVPLEQVVRLASIWYGGHLAPDWRKPTVSEARARFQQAGLTSAHWHVPEGDERF